MIEGDPMNDRLSVSELQQLLAFHGRDQPDRAYHPHDQFAVEPGTLPDGVDAAALYRF